MGCFRLIEAAQRNNSGGGSAPKAALQLVRLDAPEPPFHVGGLGDELTDVVEVRKLRAAEHVVGPHRTPSLASQTNSKVGATGLLQAVVAVVR